MTLAATRRYAFVTCVIIGILAAISAAALVSALIGSPEQVVLALSDGEIGSLLNLILDRLGNAARSLVRLLA